MAKTNTTVSTRRSKAETPSPPRAQRAERRTAKTAAAVKPAAAQRQAVAPAAARAAEAKAAPGGKLGVIVAMMRRPEGATVVQMSETTDWLPHSVRGALAGAIKKKHKLTVSSEKTEAGRVYRIAPVDVAEQTAEPSAG